MELPILDYIDGNIENTTIANYQSTIFDPKIVFIDQLVHILKKELSDEI